jgi:RHS repeat-associated protein
VTDAAGDVLNSMKYGPFGETPALSGTPFGYTGQRYDAELQAYYYKARYYSPEIGRFLSPDPIGFDAGDMNLYAYVGNDAVNLTDPAGLVSNRMMTNNKAVGLQAMNPPEEARGTWSSVAGESVGGMAAGGVPAAETGERSRAQAAQYQNDAFAPGSIVNPSNPAIRHSPDMGTSYKVTSDGDVSMVRDRDPQRSAARREGDTSISNVRQVNETAPLRPFVAPVDRSGPQVYNYNPFRGPNLGGSVRT